MAAVAAGADETISAAGFFGFMGVSMALVLASNSFNIKIFFRCRSRLWYI